MFAATVLAHATSPKFVDSIWTVQRIFISLLIIAAYVEEIILHALPKEYVATENALGMRLAVTVNLIVALAVLKSFSSL